MRSTGRFYPSPLRYPGGKTGLAGLLTQTLELNELKGCTYVEPFAGGAGAALSLLFAEKVSRVILNDLDYRIYAFWRSILGRQLPMFLDLVESTPLNMKEWTKQRDIYLHPNRHSMTRVGFATFYLNRCNKSGIIVTGGPIGGVKQRGKWKIDARFNREDLARRIQKVALFRERIDVRNSDAMELLRELEQQPASTCQTFIYLDPPYYQKSRQLYFNGYTHDDHLALAQFVKKIERSRWIVSYDNQLPIRKMYSDIRIKRFSMAHTASARKVGCELLISPFDLQLPRYPSKLVWMRGVI